MSLSNHPWREATLPHRMTRILLPLRLLASRLQRLPRWLRRTIAILAGSVLIAMLAIAIAGIPDQVVDSDLAIVPGTTVFPSGTPSPWLLGRLETTLGFYRTGRCKRILVSGGIGREGHDEAAVMKAWLTARGVPDSAVVTDNHGINSFETARFAASLIRRDTLRNPVVISQFFHVPRLRLALEKHGVRIAGNLRSRRYGVRDVWSTFREVFAWIEYLAKPSTAPAP